MGAWQSTIDEMERRDLEDAKRARLAISTTSTTPTPPLVFEDEADLSVHNTISPSRTPSPSNSQTKGSRSSIYIGRVSVPTCPLSSPSLWHLSSLPGAATLEVAGSANLAQDIQSSSVPSLLVPLTTSAPIPANNPAPTPALPPLRPAALLPTPSSATLLPLLPLPGCSTSYSRPSTVSLEPLGHTAHLPLTFKSPNAISIVDRPAVHAISVVDNRPSTPPSRDLRPPNRQPFSLRLFPRPCTLPPLSDGPFQAPSMISLFVSELFFVFFAFHLCFFSCVVQELGEVLCFHSWTDSILVVPVCLYYSTTQLKVNCFLSSANFKF